MVKTMHAHDKMNEFERIIDEIDCELFRLMNKADNLANKYGKNQIKIKDIANTIRAARLSTYYLLPDWRRKEFD